MKKKNIFIILSIMIFVFLSYITLNPLKKEEILDKNIYTLETKGMSRSTPPMFHYTNHGIYFVHPSSIIPANGNFIFKKDLKLHFHFSFQEGAKKNADIHFLIKKNNLKIKDFKLISPKTYNIFLDVKKGDKINIIADKGRGLYYDWGNIIIYKVERYIQLKNILIPFLWFILIVFLYGKGHGLVALNGYGIFITYLLAEKLNIGQLYFSSVLAYLLLFFGITLLFVLIYQELEKFKKFKIATLIVLLLTIALYLISVSSIIYVLTFHLHMSYVALSSMFQTNIKEAYEFISSFISQKYILLSLFTILFIGFMLYKQEEQEKKRIQRSSLIFIIIIIFATFFSQIEHLRFGNFLYNNYKYYTKELKSLEDMQKKRKLGEIKFNATKDEKKETYIVVIGESLDKYDMSLYGYFRDTTPRLVKQQKENNLLVFTNTYPNYTQTMQVLSYALTETNQYNHKNYFNSLDILNILNKANVETYWISNQPLAGITNNAVSIIANDANHVVRLNNIIQGNHSTMYDESTIKVLENILNEKTDKNRVVFIHLMGNHYKYNLRYPNKKFTKFNSKTKASIYGKYAGNNLINSYDNSVYYNDYIVDTLLKKLQKYSGVRGFIYFSDHSEDYLNRKGHYADLFTFNMTQIPMVMWFSKEYQEKYKNKYNILKEHVDKLFSNGMIYNTLLGIFNIKTDRYNKKYDFSDSSYELKEENALTLHGSKKYTAKGNYFYWQQANANYLKEKQLLLKVFPSNLETIGAVSDIVANGFKTLAVTINIDNNILKVSNKKEDIKFRMSLNELFAFLKKKDFKKIIINLGNIKEEEINLIKSRLNSIDEKYNIKNRVIITLNYSPNLIKLLQQDGWNIACKLDSVTMQSNKINSILTKLKVLNINLLKIDYKSYKSILNILEQYKFNIILSDSLQLNSINFKKQLEIYLKNKNIKYFEVSYVSNYSF